LQRFAYTIACFCLIAEFGQEYLAKLSKAVIYVLDIYRPYLDGGKNLAWLHDPEPVPDDLKTARGAVDAVYGLVNPTNDERFVLLCELCNKATKQ
jgi:hypothetical protein